ncbi:MAG: hypothetical protein ABIG60_03490 [Patescibacteria group bacterium]
MLNKKNLTIIIVIIIIALATLGYFYFFKDAQFLFFSKGLPAQEELNPADYPITNPEVKVITSVYLSTEQPILPLSEPLTALILVKNEQTVDKDWDLVAQLKNLEDGSVYLTEEKKVTINAEKDNREDIIFAEDNIKKLKPGKYIINLFIFEDNQLINIKTTEVELVE